MRTNKQNMDYKRKVFLESLDNLIKASSRIGLTKSRSQNLKDILGLAKGITEEKNNGKV